MSNFWRLVLGVVMCLPLTCILGLIMYMLPPIAVLIGAIISIVMFVHGIFLLFETD